MSTPGGTPDVARGLATFVVEQTRGVLRGLATLARAFTPSDDEPRPDAPRGAGVDLDDVARPQ